MYVCARAHVCDIPKGGTSVLPRKSRQHLRLARLSACAKAALDGQTTSEQ